MLSAARKLDICHVSGAQKSIVHNEKNRTEIRTFGNAAETGMTGEETVIASDTERSR